MKYELKVVVLENCPYSIAAAELLTNHKIKFKKILVNHETKYKYKTEQISTFPQIYLLNNKVEILLGGYSDLEKYEICSDIQKLIESIDSYGTERLHRTSSRTN